MDLAHDLFRVTIAPDGPDSAAMITAVDGTGFKATVFDGEFHVHRETAAAPTGDEVPEPIRGALVRARRAGKLVLVDFVAEWCAPCVRMLKEVYTEARVAKALEDRYVFLRVDTDAYPDAAMTYGVAGIPDARILAASDGREVGRIFGFQDADAVLALLAAAEKESGPEPTEQR